uniref:Erythropoietin n=2 Tax=Cynoglossus semilaevis TaxID=244447 RepID=A0A3P8W215_CYNSE
MKIPLWSFPMLQKSCRGLLALLLILLEWTQTGLLYPLRPICDRKVLELFIKEARDAEDAMKSCSDGCSLSNSVTVPKTQVVLDLWEHKNELEKAQEVQSGLWLIEKALNLLRTNVRNTALHSHIDNSIRNLGSLNAVLLRLNIQEYVPPTNTADISGTWGTSSATDLFPVYINFLRGKVNLLLKEAQACQTDVS